MVTPPNLNERRVTASAFLPRRSDARALVLLAVGYAVLALAGLNWGVYRGASTAVWPASGLAFAALFLGGVRLWPAILVGRMAAAVIVGSAPPFWADLVIALASAVSAALPVAVIKARMRLDPDLARVRDVMALIAASLVGAVISVVPGVGVLVLSGVSPPAQAPLAGVTWFLGYTTGALLITPLILAWSRIRAEPSLFSWRLLAAAVIATGAALVIFLDLTPLPLRTWHLFPVLAWVAIAFRVRGVTLALVGTAVAALVSVGLGSGPLAELIGGSPARAFYAQDFIAVTAGTLLLLAAAADESRHQAALARAQTTKAAVFDAALDAIITTATDGRVVDWNREAERMFRLTKAEAVGRDLTKLIIPPDQRDSHRRRLASLAAGGRAAVLGQRLELQVQRGDGAPFPAELSVNVATLDDGLHFTASLRDMTEQVSARQRLADQDQRLRATYEHAPVGIAEVDHDGRIRKVNEALCTITGRDRRTLLARTIWDDSPAEGQGDERELFTLQMAGKLETYAIEKSFTRADGETAWVELRSSRVEGGEGRPAYAVRVVRDITQEKRWAQQQLLLINELNHRVKNTLTTVQSITFQTLRNGGAEASVQTAIEGRLLALSRAHDVLTRQNWEAADLAEIVDVAARPYLPGPAERLRVAGPHVRLTPQTALGLAMALQELATNALKYGAWSSPEGVVDIAWQVSADKLALTWRESGGPPVTRPKRRGFGARLLERGVGPEVGGSCVLAFEPEGLVCEITAAVA